MNFTFQIVSPTHGTFIVIAPDRFRKEIEARTWCVMKDPKRVVGRNFVVMSNQKTDKGKYRKLYLHRFVRFLGGHPSAKTVDHFDGQPLNNSEDNLRDATFSQNSQNRRLQSNNTSGIKGVSWDKPRGKWKMQIQSPGRSRGYGGLFDSLKEAKEAYDAAARVFHGDFAILNTSNLR